MLLRNDGRKLFFDETELEIIQLPGYSPNQSGIAIKDILFCADSVLYRY